MKLLIVDDSSLIRRSINSAYRNSIFTEIETAVDGMLAVTMFRQMLPDVVTLDITMPHMDGLAAMTKMLEIKPNTIILVISALADHHTAIESLTRGAHQFICKPFTDDDLKEALDSLLADTKTGQKVYTPESDASNQMGHDPGESASQFSEPTRKPAEPPVAHYPSGYVPPPISQSDPIGRGLSTLPLPIRKNSENSLGNLRDQRLQLEE